MLEAALQPADEKPADDKKERRGRRSLVSRKGQRPGNEM